MWEKHRNLCITYHKFPRDIWPEQWFVNTELKMPNGERLTVKLAEMGSWVGDKKNGLWVREVRKLGKHGHQTSLISTAKSEIAPRDAVLLEPMVPGKFLLLYDEMKHFAIDLLSEYGTEEFPGKQRVVNPTWRELERQRRSLKSKLANRAARYAALELHPEMDDEKVAKWKRQKG